MPPVPGLVPKPGMLFGVVGADPVPGPKPGIEVVGLLAPEAPPEDVPPNPGIFGSSVVVLSPVEPVPRPFSPSALFSGVMDLASVTAKLMLSLRLEEFRILLIRFSY